MILHTDCFSNSNAHKKCFYFLYWNELYELDFIIVLLLSAFGEFGFSVVFEVWSSSALGIFIAFFVFWYLVICLTSDSESECGFLLVDNLFSTFVPIEITIFPDGWFVTIWGPDFFLSLGVFRVAESLIFLSFEILSPKINNLWMS